MPIKQCNICLIKRATVKPHRGSFTCSSCVADINVICRTHPEYSVYHSLTDPATVTRGALASRAFGSDRVLLQTPAHWAGWDAMRETVMDVYMEAIESSWALGTQMDAEHTIPLNNPLVSGLHVPDNLGIMEHIANVKKGNKYDIHSYEHNHEQ